MIAISGMIGIPGGAPYRMVANAILAPSGDQAAPESQAESVVTRVTSPVWTSIVQMSVLPGSIWQSYAMRAPSGDQAGHEWNPTLLVSRVTPDPSATFMM